MIAPRADSASAYRGNDATPEAVSQSCGPAYWLLPAAGAFL